MSRQTLRRTTPINVTSIVFTILDKQRTFRQQLVNSRKVTKPHGCGDLRNETHMVKDIDETEGLK